jgi:Na+-translocating ferredoxin:NAD+ oxidoreductase subunit E
MADNSFVRLKNTLTNGIVKENPTFRLVLGMCPTLAVTTMAANGISMGLATTAVLVCSNLIISSLRNIIPGNVRIPSFIVVIASFTTIVQLFIKAYLPSLDQTLGIYIPLIVVNCIIFARAESFAFSNPPMESIMDGLGMGLGFTLAITILASLRELIGKGTFFGMQVLPASVPPMTIVGQAPGGFIMLGLVLTMVNLVVKKTDKRKAAKMLREEEVA